MSVARPYNELHLQWIWLGWSHVSGADVGFIKGGLTEGINLLGGGVLCTPPSM